MFYQVHKRYIYLTWPCPFVSSRPLVLSRFGNCALKVAIQKQSERKCIEPSSALRYMGAAPTEVRTFISMCLKAD